MNQEKVWDAIGKPWKYFRQGKVSQVLEFIKDKQGKVLDLGCGSGRNFIKNKNLKFYGVDFSEEMLKLAKKYAEKERINIKLTKSDVDKIPFSDNFFDAGIFSAVLHCVDSSKKRKKAIEELFRVLKLGAKAIISVWGRGSPRLKNKEKESFIPWTVGNKKYLRYTYIYDKEELEQEVRNAGFKIVSSEEDRNINLVVRKVI